MTNQTLTKEKNVNVITSEQCCGCGACYNKCPAGAISMQENNEGFLAPVVDETKCTNCGMCQKACPSINVKYKNNPKPDCYAAMADDEIRMKSSSGGMFTLLANFILDKGGYVCGAAFDDDWNVHHIIIDNKEDLSKLRGSKYVQSDTENCYKEIKKLLDADKYVLFSGCPCQVAGLYTFLGKEYGKLLSVDILCHGAASRKVWKKYLTENFQNKNILNINFRDKSETGWACTHCTIILDNNEKFVSDDYTKLFHKSIITRECCEKCQYSKFPRIGDLSLGDFWGINNYDNDFNDGKGTSLILINNKKVQKIFNSINIRNKKITLNYDYDNGHIRYERRLNKNRKRFFRNLDKYNLKKNYEACINNHYDICLLTSFFAENYGAILVAYAVHKILKDLGYSVLMLQKPNFIGVGTPSEKNYAMIFGRKHYEISKPYNSIEEMYKLNEYCSTFIVGSDQLFNYKLRFFHCLLEFASLIKNKIAFGTSFGNDKYLGNEKETIFAKYLFSRFNHIALREKGDNLTKIFNLENAIEVIDPTQMISIEDYCNLCKDVYLKEAQEPYLLTYDLDINPQKTDAIKYLAHKLNLKIIYLPACYITERKSTELKPYREKYTTEEFLYLYKNASFVVSDSYHGSLFAVKFNKPFISFVNSRRGGLRYKIFDELGLNNRLVSCIEDVYINDILTSEIDYREINKIIKSKSEAAIEWLGNALQDSNHSSKFTPYEIYTDIINKEKDLKIKNLKEKLEFTILEDPKSNSKISYIYNRKKINYRYLRYKILSKILLGKKRKHYKEKAKIWHEKVRLIRNLTKELSKI